LGFSEYWSLGKNYVDALGYRNIFNLWRITEDGKDLYAKQVEEYLRRTYFANKDLSAVSVGLVEAYYNVFDHARAQGNAFSLIQFDEETSILYIAISDFGIGIAQSVSDFDKEITNDRDAILKALEDNFTVRSTERNKGMGLSIIIAPAIEARIFSHNGLVYKHDSIIEDFDCKMSFPGTLIYYEIDLSKMDDEEIMNEFDFFN
jgi:anti-sigma regulatory factor (Ser/Thr protein kinase)